MARKRRGRGEGSIHQRGDGLWVATASAGYAGDGRRLRLTGYGKTKAEALLKLKEKLAAATGGVTQQESAKLTLAAYLTHWLDRVKPSIEPNTFAPYKRHVDLHIVPHVGGMKLLKLERVHVEGLYVALAKAGVSAAMQRKVGGTLTRALNAAVETRVLRFNPATGVKKPKAAPPEMQVLDLDQVGRFLQAAEGERLYAFYLLALDSGMRPGELFALGWGDIDFGGGFVVVRRSLEEIEGRFRLKDVKTKKGRRRIDLAAGTLTALHEHRKRMLADGHAAGPVFCNTEGGYQGLANLHRDSFKPLLRRAGLPDIRLYDLRHTSATLLLLADVNPKIVSERLGHSSIRITLDTYSHVLPTMGRGAADKMGAILAARPAKKAE